MACEMKTTKDSVQYTREMEHDQYFIRLFEKACALQNLPKKCAKQADLYRKKGNEEYVQKNYVRALCLFNQSMCYAPNGSQQLCKAYANRSATYLVLEMYDNCLQNIQMARDTGYPVNLISKLDERELKCQNKLTEINMSGAGAASEFIGLEPALSYPAHEKIPFIANCLEVKENEQYGRHIVTNTDLNVGDIVGIEKPYVGMVPNELSNLYCANCLSDNDLNLLPCPSCHLAMFCSLECRDQANKAFHDIECPIMDILLESDLIAQEQKITAIRLAVLAVKAFKSVDELIKFVKDFDNEAFPLTMADYEQNTAIDLVATVLKLERFDTRTNNEDRLIVGLYSAMLYKSLLNYTEFKELFKNKDEIEFLIDILYRMTGVALLNTFPLTENSKMLSKSGNFMAALFCPGIYPFSSLMNHSCAPNTAPIKYRSKNVIIVMKPIEKGQQLFTHYFW